jgi:hypothetical protein
MKQEREEMKNIFNEISMLNEDELRQLNKFVVDRIKHIMDEKTSYAKMNFNVGDKVAFTNRKTNERYHGKITKINRKTADVACNIIPSIKWRVDMGMLEKE